MPKVLTVTPKDGESPEDFAARASDQVTQFFGSDSGDTAGTDAADQPVDTGTGDGGDGYDSTDVSADTQDSGDQTGSGS